MESLPVEIYSVAAVRESDRCAIEEHGIPGYTLMVRAGEAAIRAARSRFPNARRMQVVCGAGNNAGDGYVVARLAAAQGIAVSAIALTDPGKLTGDAATAYGDFAAEGGVVLPWEGRLDSDADLLVDAILGSGLERDVNGVFADAVVALNQHPAPVQALDIPTGLHGDTGKIMGTAVTADQTVTFVGLKSGLVLGDGPSLCGELVFTGLEIPDDCIKPGDSVLRRISRQQLIAGLPPRARGAHKGDFGHVLVVGGGEGMPGAVRLCGEAALRSGAGRVSIATHPAHAAQIASGRPELMSHAIAEARELDALLQTVDVVAFGPGLGQGEWAEWVYASVAKSELPCVWDADALNILAREGGKSERRVITPHPGEAASLLAMSTADVQADRRAAVIALQQRYGGTAVLKGAGSLVASGAGSPWVSTAGNPGMAAPGMGDALTGVTAALIGQGLELAEAARLGVFAHALAGDRAAAAGERGLIASDLIAELRAVLNP